MKKEHHNPNPIISQIATKYGFHPSRTYGQNFLIDETVVNRIITASGADSTDTVVEIGPGFGILTKELTAVSGRVVAFEIEKKLIEYWDEQMVKHPNLQIIWGNALKTFPDICKTLPEHYKVVANLPYQITSAAIRMMLEAARPPAKMTIMVQKEVGERICAKPGDMSLLAVSVQYYADPKLELFVPSSAFWPPPKVDSAVVTLIRHKDFTPSLEDEWFFKVVKQGFSNRRKLLIKNLLGLVGNKQKAQLSQIFNDLSLNQKVRAQELSVATWKELAKVLKKLQNS